MATFPEPKVSRLALATLLWAVFVLQSRAGEIRQDGSESPEAWLGRMNRSVATLSFEGNFVYLSGRFLEAMRLSHQVVGGRLRESLFSLTGEPRRIVRDGGMLAITTWVDGKPHTIRQPSKGRLSPLKPLEARALRRYYHLMMGKPARIAGREGVVVALVPRDGLRYGYRLTLDRESGLPLDLTVMDGEGNLISRIMFTRLKLRQAASVVEAEKGNGPPPAATAMAAPPPPEKEGASQEGSPDSSWTFQELPAGFRLVSHKRLERGRQEHFVFSDGLATVSAYVEPLGKGDQAFTGETSLGSVNAYGRRLDGHQLTVVGEVPHKTLRLVAQALRRKE